MRTLLASLGLLVCLPVMANDAHLHAAISALQNPNSVLIDVRTAAEFAEGALTGAEQIDHEEIANRISALAPDKDTPIVLYCRSGRRSGIAEDSLRALGYSNLINGGGYEELKVALESQD
ncbi:MAG: rhodanese-like domain-containing protein [Pseudomonadaceae bacterium]|uniref:rhodanese-like domain-containing protein n=1 Tax=Pseudomonas sp. Ga0074129 TaxID=1752219 RepID=UPI000AB1444C|nr:rhodanese-like domain-containing protein [Pseudomonas sp. Ga0074129]MBX9762999.1 rhodanese-like domain-containing protein [Pseudomonadaceae bacterium]